MQKRRLPIFILFYLVIGYELLGQTAVPENPTNQNQAVNPSSTPPPTQEPQKLPPPPTWSDGFTAGALVRVRPELKYNLDFNRNTNDNVDFTGQKIQFWIQKEFTKDVIAKITFQDARLWGAEKGSLTGLSTANDGTRQSTDVREAYIEVKNNFNLPFHIQAGRQILRYGDERLVGSLDWTNIGRSFDGLRLKWDDKYISSHIFVTSVSERHSDIAGNTTSFGVKNQYSPYLDCPYNGTKACTLKPDAQRQELGDSYFTGFYNTLKPSDYFHIDLYYLGLQKEYLRANQSLILTTGETGNPASRASRWDILHTYGIRITNRTQANKKALQALDYSFEYAVQTGTTGKSIRPRWDNQRTEVTLTDPLTNGTYNHNLYSEKEKYKTFAFGADVGYTIEKLRLGVAYDIGSGDPNRTDGSIASFQNLFHTNHLFYGMADQVSWVNMKSKSVNATYNLGTYGNFRVDYFAIEKHKLQDSWYDVAGVAKTGASTESITNNSYDSSQVLTEKGAGDNRPVSMLGRSLFREIDFKYNMPYKNLILECGYSMLFAGDAIQNRVNDRTINSQVYTNQFSKNAQFAYLMVTAQF
ncbi:PF13372 domain protein [Leptospira wolbachii serovar Codice str. CDC]|uniref:PF13372 domain protein n=1 Tax=Leptospira wolbachii serovar Codice str. CDC TaxID=1218599 RepID=R9A462_9LEPT|nr:alginate export family protein [Leptospira wolbachii]EOQ95035.1 PF13372 domain protein [Leptospira wolbachii serovar Codice str. CDC]